MVAKGQRMVVAFAGDRCWGVDGDGKTEIVVAPSDDTIRLIDAKGRPRWVISAPATYKTKPQVGVWDGRTQIVVGIHDVGVWSLDQDGNRLWDWPIDRRMSFATLADINGDGEDEILVNVAGCSLMVLNGLGKELWDANTSQGPSQWRICSPPAVATIDGQTTVLMGTERDGLVAMDSTGQLLWSSAADGVVAGGAVRVETADGGRIVYGSTDQHVRCVDDGGNLVWATALVGSIQATPTVAEIGDGGDLYILIGSGRQMSVAVLDIYGNIAAKLPGDAVWGQSVAYTKGDAIYIASDACVRSVDVAQALDIFRRST
jgi:hypothetical protein